MTASRLEARLDTLQRPDLRAVHVVIPAHDEQLYLGACLRSVARAVTTLRSRCPQLEVSVTVVLDRCTDDTAAVAEACGAATISVDLGCVGPARRAGVRAFAERTHDAAGTVLVVTTDADCVVPSSWLVEHVELARSHDLVFGDVEPDVGVRLDTYDRAGGFPGFAVEADALLVRVLRDGGSAVIGGPRVQASGRREGRSPDGLAGYLHRLDAEVALAATRRD